MDPLNEIKSILKEFREEVNSRMDRFEKRMDQFEKRMDQFEKRMDQFEKKLDTCIRICRMVVRISGVSVNQMELISTKLSFEKNIRSVTVNLEQIEAEGKGKGKGKSKGSKFVWDATSENQQMYKVLKFFKANLDLDKKIEYIDISYQSGFLSCIIADDTIELNGTADLAGKFNDKTKFIIQVKKDSKSITSQANQSVVELLAASKKSDDPVLHLLTDLGENWVFRWLEKSYVCVFSVENSNKLQQVKHFMNQFLLKKYPFANALTYDAFQPSENSDIEPQEAEQDIPIPEVATSSRAEQDIPTPNPRTTTTTTTTTTTSSQH